ncbi:MAG: insulinase family protein [Pirellulaceae bacterium]|nr:insulinase family protein [Pirellulaceae bacterium]
MSTTLIAQRPVDTCHLPNGMTLLAEPMPWLQSVAFCFLLPSGSCYDPITLQGLGSMTNEMVQRGCGHRNSRQFTHDLDALGIDRSFSTSTLYSFFGGVGLSANLEAALALYTDLLRNPLLPEEQLEEARLVSLQEVLSVEDDPAQKVFEKLQRKQYPGALGQPTSGTKETLQAISYNDIVDYYQKGYQPKGTTLSVAGNYNWPKLKEFFEDHFSDWEVKERPPVLAEPIDYSYDHLEEETSQTHIGLSYDAVPLSHDNYYRQRAALGVLSDGMSSRLFSNIREKQGLCYTVFANLQALKNQASIMCYAGTSTDRAQRTLDSIFQEVATLRDGINQGELDRFKVRFKSGLIRQQESSLFRCQALARQWFQLGKLRSIVEIYKIIEELGVQEVNEYLLSNTPEKFNVVTLGAQQLEVSL